MAGGHGRYLIFNFSVLSLEAISSKTQHGINNVGGRWTFAIHIHVYMELNMMNEISFLSNETLFTSTII